MQFIMGGALALTATLLAGSRPALSTALILDAVAGALAGMALKGRGEDH